MIEQVDFEDILNEAARRVVVRLPHIISQHPNFYPEGNSYIRFEDRNQPFVKFLELTRRGREDEGTSWLLGISDIIKVSSTNFFVRKEIASLVRETFLDHNIQCMVLADQMFNNAILGHCKNIAEAFCPIGTFDWITLKNPSSNAPYHNSIHEALVFNYCYQGAVKLDLLEKEKTILLLAAAFHDFDHTAGAQSDDVNIERACAGFKEAKLIMSDNDYDEVINLIKITRYPYIREPKTLSEMILLDADKMMPYANKDVAVKLFKGLRAEFATSGKTFTDDEYITGLKNFYNNIQWHTLWAKDRVSRYNFSSLVDSIADDLV